MLKYLYSRTEPITYFLILFIATMNHLSKVLLKVERSQIISVSIYKIVIIFTMKDRFYKHFVWYVHSSRSPKDECFTLIVS